VAAKPVGESRVLLGCPGGLRGRLENGLLGERVLDPWNLDQLRALRGAAGQRSAQLLGGLAKALFGVLGVVGQLVSRLTGRDGIGVRLGIAKGRSGRAGGPLVREGSSS
jgi:hypothetical protein